MAKRKTIKESNRPFTYNPHYYKWGGEFLKALNLKGAFNFKDTFSGANVANMLKGGAASAIGSAVGNIAGNAISGGLESGAGSAINNIGSTLGSAVSTVNPVLGGIMSAGSGILGGAANALFGSKLNQEKINEIEGSNRGMSTLMVDNSSADSVMNQWANQDFGKDFTKSDIGKDGLFSNKAKNKYNKLKKQQDIARNRALTSYENAADAADTQTDLNAMANFAAFGGPLGIWDGYGSGAVDYELTKENLGIKALNAANKGRITSLPNSFGSELNVFANGGPEKNAIVSYAELDTYYPFISNYPYTGHSSLNITDTIDGHKLNRPITKRFRDKGYNLLTNNCSNATREALEKTFNQKLNPFLFTTPGDVQDFALEKLHGVPEVKGDSIFIPNEGKYVLNTKELKSKRLRKGLSTVFIPVTQKQKETLINIYKDNIYKNNLEKLLKYRNDNRMNNKKILAEGGNTHANGGKIHIKPENRGKFTEYCGGKVTSECIAKGKRSSDPAVRKRATFAANSRKWKHDDGGPLDSLVADINRRSKADFVQRLLDSNRDYIQDWESDNIATHKLGWATDDKGAIVFPNVQRINGKLYDFTDPKNKREKWDALDSAIERGDTLRMTPAQAEEFTKTYKKYYPKGKTFKAFGGDLLTHGAEWDNGVTVIGNGGTHEYLEGQEYDVTEEEIKLLKKLGYEFEYL